MRLNRWEIGAALTVVLIGLYVAAEGVGYGVGTLRHMGPGFFPLAVGVGLLGLGLAILVETRHATTPAPDLPARPLAAILGGLLLFALLVSRAGLVPATLVLVMVAAFADVRMTLARAAVSAVGIAALGWVVFVAGFRLPLHPFWW